jgi:hypothetical protein
MNSDLERAVNPLLRLQQGSIILRFNKQIDVILFYGGYDWTPHMVKPHQRGMVLAATSREPCWMKPARFAHGRWKIKDIKVK